MQFKEAIEKAGLKVPHLMCQALGYMTPDADQHYGWCQLDDFPYCKGI